jgi:hypothetical protein
MKLKSVFEELLSDYSNGVITLDRLVSIASTFDLNDKELIRLSLTITQKAQAK